MTKFLVVALVALLAIALVACGGSETPATTKGADTTAAPATTPVADTTPALPGDTSTVAPATQTKAPATESTAPETDPTTPEVEGIDLLFEEGYMAIGDMGSGFFAFEDFHASLDNNVALVINMNDQGGVYNDLFIVDTENTDSNNNWEPNMD